MEQPVVPPRTETETHEQYMSNFINLLVNTTKHASEFTKLEDDTHALFLKIIHACRETMLKAARTRHSSAVIFAYCINRNNGIYDLLFPTGHIAQQMEKHNISPVFQRVQNHMAPLELEHKIYEVYDGDAVEIINHTGQLILPNEIEDDSQLPELVESQDTPIEGVQKLKPVRRHIGVITVSWAKQVNTE